jgi:hypothetical protein
LLRIEPSTAVDQMNGLATQEYRYDAVNRLVVAAENPRAASRCSSLFRYSITADISEWNVRLARKNALGKVSQFSVNVAA